MPPREWGVGAHSKHLRNLYIYFWRWATWKVFDHHPGDTGIVCFITVAGFLSGPGFQKMRDYLRRACDDIWVIDCSPEGHQPEVNTRIFRASSSRCASCSPRAPPATKRTSRQKCVFNRCPPVIARKNLRRSLASRSAARRGWIVRRTGALRFCRHPPARGPRFPRWRICSFTTAPACNQNGFGLSLQIQIR